MKNISNLNHTSNADHTGDTSNIVTLDFEQNLLKQYIKLERKTQVVVNRVLSGDKAINLRAIDQIEQHLLTLKVCLESLEEERVQESSRKTSRGKESETHINRQIDARKFHLINSMEKLLELLKSFKDDSVDKNLSVCWIPRII